MDKREIKHTLDTALKDEARQRNWRSADAAPYWVDKETLFRVCGDSNGKAINFSLRLKYTPLDKVLWRVLGLKLDEFKPSLHVNGAYATHARTIDALSVPIGASAADLSEAVHAYCEFAQARAQQVTGMIARDGYAATLEGLLGEYAARYPRVRIDFDVEKVLGHLQQAAFGQAKEIVLPNIAAKKTGGFFVGKTFYQRALDYIEANA